MLFYADDLQGKRSDFHEGPSRRTSKSICSSAQHQIQWQTSYMMHVISINGETQSLLDESKQDIWVLGSRSIRSDRQSDQFWFGESVERKAYETDDDN